MDVVPGREDFGLFAAKDQLATGVFLVFDEHFHLVAHLQVGLVTEFGEGHQAIRLKANVQNYITVSDAYYRAFDYFFLADGR